MQLLILVVLLMCTGSAHAQLQLRFEPATTNMTIGEEKTFNLVVDGGFTNLLGLEFTMTFDNGRLDFVDAWPLLDTLGAFNGMELNYIPPPGTPFFGPGIRMIWTDVQGTGKSVAPGTAIAAVRLRAKAAGSSQLRVFCDPLNNYNCEVIDQNGNNVGIPNPQPATINISSGPFNGATLILGNATGPSGSTVCVPVTANNFTNIQLAEFSVTWPEANLEFASIANCNQAMGIVCNPEPPNFGIVNNTLNFSWFIFSGGVTLPQGSTLFEICFNVNGNVGQTFGVNFTGNIQLRDSAEQIVPTNTVNGSVTIGNTKTMTLDLGTREVCPQDTFCVPLKTKDFTNIIGLNTFMTFDTTKVKLVAVKGCSPKLTGIDCNLGSLSFSLNTQGKSDTLSLLYEDKTFAGVTLDTNDVYAQFCFQNLMAEGDSVDLRFLTANSNGSPSEAVDIDGVVGLIQKNGKIRTVKCDCDINVTAAITTNVKCNGGTDGAINLIVTGGSGNFTYVWQPVLPNTKNPTNLQAGTYKVTIVDNTIPDCTWESGNINVTQPPAINITGVVTHESCEGELDGSIALTITGGTPPYTVNWGGGKTGNPLTNLAGGDYAPTVTDANGCTRQGPLFTVNSTNIDPGMTTSTNVTCFGAKNGTITLSLPPGTFTVTWDPSTAGTGPNLTNLGPGFYTPTIMSSTGCTVVLEPIQITEPSQIQISGEKTDIACHGSSTGSIVLTVTGGTGSYTYLWNGGSTDKDRSNMPAGSHTVTVTDQAGCTRTQSFTLVNSHSAITVTSTTQNATAGQSNGGVTLTVSGGLPNFTYLWSNGAVTKDLTGVTAGAYSVTVTDAAGCTRVHNATVNQADDNLVTFQLSQFDMFNVSCHGICDGTAVAFPPGSAVQPVTFKWSQNAGGGTSAIASDLCANVVYSVTITDATGKAFVGSTTLTSSAAWTIEVITLGEPPLAGAYVAVNGPFQQPYAFLWSTGDTTETIQNLEAGNYCVTVTNVRNCSKTACAEIVDMECLQYREVITPNNDNTNDQFWISCITDERYRDHKLEIFNRWGQLVYATTNYQNNWMGTGPSGTELAEGLYFFVLEYELFGETQLLKGTINILR